MLNFQCRQPNGTTMARTLNLALLLGYPICSSSGRFLWRTLQYFSYWNKPQECGGVSG